MDLCKNSYRKRELDKDSDRKFEFNVDVLIGKLGSNLKILIGNRRYLAKICIERHIVVV